MYFYVLITNMQKLKSFKCPNWLIRQLDNWLKLKLSYEFSYFDIAMYFLCWLQICKN